jgi:hypothetical protein
VWACASYHDASDCRAAYEAVRKAAPGLKLPPLPVAAASRGGGAGPSGASSSSGAPAAAAGASAPTSFASREEFPTLAPSPAAAAPANAAAAGSASGEDAAGGGAPSPAVLRFLFFGPEDGSVGALDWYYLDPSGTMQVGWGSRQGGGPAAVEQCSWVKGAGGAGRWTGTISTPRGRCR